MDKAIFKKYDIRGIYPDQMVEEDSFHIARAFVDLLLKDSDKQASELKIIAGHDMRTSGPQMYKAYISGLLSKGVEVFDAGLLAIDQMYFALGHFEEYDAGGVVTASHNPKEYNGFKMYRKGVNMLTAEDIQEIGNMAEADTESYVDHEGRVTPVNFDEAYTERMLSFVDLEAIKPMKVVLDAGNGMAGRNFSLVLPHVHQLDAITLYFEPDGTFPNHEPNPEKVENTVEIRERVVSESAAFGAAFDGDSDRMALVDENGEILRGDIITGILARNMLERHPGSSIVYNVLCTKGVADLVEKYGGIPVEWKTGHTFMKEKMREVDAVFGGELSGHLFFKDFYFAESSPIAFLMICEILSKTGKKLSELAEEVKQYATWARYIYLDEGDTVEAAMDRVVAKYKEQTTAIETIDGYTLRFEDPWWWFNVRPSNTEPRLHLTIESKEASFTQAKKEEIFTITKGRIAGDG